MPRMPVPFGDDVSALNLGRGKLAVLKTDMLVARTDVPPKMTLWQAARKAVVMNISDFAAKGVKPKAILVSLGLPRDLSEEGVQEIADGLNAGAREYGAYVIGGDTGESSDLTISISLFGTAEEGEVLLRSGARPGDLLAVTGRFGKTAAGLRILVDNLEAPDEIRGTLVESVLMPRARLEEGLALSRTKAVTAAIDSSDGLAWSLHEIASASNIGFLIQKLPTANETARLCKISNLDPTDLTLYGGEEYELVLTIKPKLWNKAEKAVNRAGGTLLQIGKATAEKRVLLETKGRRHTIEPRGYEHFRT
jgi:thiamine-monophosphate kinase